jgi:ABC-2 type transport system permease protein
MSRHARLLLRLRGRAFVNLIGQVRTESRLKTGVVTVFALGFWVLMFAMFYDVFRFLGRFEGIQQILLDYLFAFFFLALLAMMAISNGIIAYSSLFRSAESEYLMALPLPRGLIYTYKSLDSLVFSSWGMLTIVVPMILAYGVTARNVSWLFYPASILFAAVFIFLPTWAGAIAALFLTRFFPRKRRNVLIVVSAACVLVLGALGHRLWMEARGELFSEGNVKNILGRIAFCQYWLLPSRWVSEGMLSFSRGNMGRSGFFFLVLLSNALVLGVAARGLGGLFYGRAWATAQSRGSRKQYRADGRLDRFIGRLLFPVPRQMRHLVMKDIKTFRRDPAQWSQCLLFFGLLALYIMNLPRMHHILDQPYWRTLVSFLNLAATCLTLSTFTSRFVFPQLSLEGKRFWVLGLMPIESRTILWGKFVFAAGGSLLISGSLITASDLILGLPWWMFVMHLFVVLVACCGLSGLAVGLGTLYPDLRAESPSKIVSSFGGTLNLLLSIGYVALVTALVGLPMHAYGADMIPDARVWLVVAFTVAAELVVGAVATFVPMKAGLRALRRMEF